MQFLFVALLLFGLLSKATIAYQRSINSDDCQPAVVYYDIVENGNYRLQDWYLVTNSHLLTEFPLYFLLGKAIGMGPFTTKLGAFLIYLAGIGLLFLLVRRTFGTNAALCAAAAIATASATTRILFHTYVHAGAIAYGLATVYLVLVLSDTRSALRSALLMSILFVLSLAASFSNPFYIFSCALPLSAALVVLLPGRRGLLDAPRAISVCFLLIVAGILGVMAQGYVQTWGPHISRLPSDQASLEMVASNAVSYLKATAFLYGIEFGGDAGWIQRIAISPMSTVLLAVPLFLIPGMVGRETSRPGRFVIVYFLFICLTLSGAFVLKSVVAPRYLTPLMYAWAAFLALAITERSGQWPRLRRLLLVFFVLIAIYNVREGFSFRERQDMAEEADLLRREGLSYGYASFWNSNLLTVLTGNEVRVRPLEFRDFRMEPFLWASNARWYMPSIHEGMTFLLVRKGDTYQGFGQLNRPLLEQMMGPVERVIETDRAVIYVWPYNIMRALLPLDEVSPDDRPEAGRIGMTGSGYAAEARPGEAGVIMRGKARHLAPGNYRARFVLLAEGDQGVPAALIGVYRVDAGSVREVATREIAAGPEGRWREELLDFSLPSDKSLTARFEFRVYANGAARVMVRSVTREPLP